MPKTKILFTAILCLISLYSSAQERGLIQGTVRGQDGPLENVTAVNISSKRASITNRSGEFQLEARAGDTLVFSHVGMDDYIKFLDSSDVSTNSLDILMIDTFNELDEVNLTDVSEINAVSLGIIPEEIERLSVNERRLQTAGDFKPIHLLGLLGGSLQVDPIVNYPTHGSADRLGFGSRHSY